MLIMVWIVLIINALSGIIQFTNVFNKGKKSERIISFIGLIVNCLTIVISLNYLRG